MSLDRYVEAMQPDTKVIDVFCDFFNTTASEFKQKLKSWDTRLVPSDPLVKPENRAKVMQFANDLLTNFQVLRPLLIDLEISAEYVEHIIQTLTDVTNLTVERFFEQIELDISRLAPLKEAFFSIAYDDNITVEELYVSFGFKRPSALKDYAKVLKNWKANHYVLSPESITNLGTFGMQYAYYTFVIGASVGKECLRSIFHVIDIALAYEQPLLELKIEQIEKFLSDLPSHKSLWKSCQENIGFTNDLRESAIQYLQDLRTDHMEIKTGLKKFFGFELNTSFSGIIWFTGKDMSMFHLLKTWLPFASKQLGLFRDFTTALSEGAKNLREVVSVIENYFNFSSLTETYDKLIRSIPSLADSQVPLWKSPLFEKTNIEQHLTGMQQSLQDMVFDETSFFEVIGKKNDELTQLQEKIRRVHDILSIEGSFCDGLERRGYTVKRACISLGDLLKNVNGLYQQVMSEWELVQPHKETLDKIFSDLGTLGHLLSTGQFTLSQLLNALWHESSILVEILTKLTEVLMAGSPSVSEVVAVIPRCFWDITATVSAYKQIRVFSFINIADSIKLDETSSCGLSFTILTVCPLLLFKHLALRLSPIVSETGVVTLKDLEAASGFQLSLSLIPIMHSLHLLSSDGLSPGVALEYLSNLPVNSLFRSTHDLLVEVNENNLTLGVLQTFSDSLVNFSRELRTVISDNKSPTQEPAPTLSPWMSFLTGVVVLTCLVAVLMLLGYFVKRDMQGFVTVHEEGDQELSPNQMDPLLSA